MEKSILNYDLMRRYTAICVSHLRIPTMKPLADGKGAKAEEEK